MAAARARLEPPKPALDQASTLIGGNYQVDFAVELPGAGGGLQAFAAIDRRHGRAGLMAVAARPDAPVRAHMINLLLAQRVEGVLSPIGQGSASRPGGRPDWFVVCEAPPGPAIWQPPFAPIQPWSESDLLDFVLRPAAHALEQLHARHLTHRAVRPGNIFRAGSRDPVVLGSAWAAPPASLQAAIYEPPYVAACLAPGRGDGSIADDVYALGVVLLALSLGNLPLEGINPAEVVRRKIEHGSFAALVGEARLPSTIADLVRGMLAEDPEHRPAPLLLADPMAARARRVAARPARRAQRALEIGGQSVWTARMLAHAVAAEPEAGTRLLRNGGIDRWVRRSLGDSLLAARLDEVLHPRGGEAGGENQVADAILAMRAVAVLDPLAPLCWRGLALWPDGLGPLIVANEAALQGVPGAADRLQQMMAAEAVVAWGSARPERCDTGLLRLDAHLHRTLLRLRGWGGGMPRLRYALNPLLACRSPLLAGRIVVRLSDLLPALEEIAGRGGAHGKDAVILDRELAAFIAARQDGRVERDLIALGEASQPQAAALIQLRLLASLQSQHSTTPMPALAAQLAVQVAPALEVWRSRDRRERMRSALTGLTSAGRLDAMLTVLEDPATRHADQRELQAAKARLAAIDARIGAIEGGDAGRRETARRIGRECVTGIGATALTIAVMGAWLS